MSPYRAFIEAGQGDRVTALATWGTPAVGYSTTLLAYISEIQPSASWIGLATTLGFACVAVVRTWVVNRREVRLREIEVEAMTARFAHEQATRLAEIELINARVAAHLAGVDALTGDHPQLAPEPPTDGSPD